MNRLVAHLAAGAAQIFQRRHNRCPTHHLHQFYFANHPGLDLPAQLLVAGVEAAVKANGHRYPERQHFLDDLAGAGQRKIDRFFAVDRFPGAGGSLQQRRV